MDVSHLCVQTTSVVILFFLQPLLLGDKNVSVTSQILSSVINDSIFLIFVSKTTGIWFLNGPLFFQVFVGIEEMVLRLQHRPS